MDIEKQLKKYAWHWVKVTTDTDKINCMIVGKIDKKTILCHRFATAPGQDRLLPICASSILSISLIFPYDYVYRQVSKMNTQAGNKWILYNNPLYTEDRKNTSTPTKTEKERDMTRIKIFYCSNVEKTNRDVNNWLAENSNIKVINTSISNGAYGGAYIVIIYMPNEELAYDNTTESYSALDEEEMRKWIRSTKSS